MRSTSFSVFAFLITLSAGLAGCKGADGDTCKEDDDCSGTLMCCRVGVERGSCGVTCDMATDSGPSIDTGPTPDSGPMSDVLMMSDTFIMSDVPGDTTTDTGEDAGADVNDAGPGDAGADANVSTDAGPDADVAVADAGPDADAA